MSDSTDPRQPTEDDGVSDGRKKYVSVISKTGERETHQSVYVCHTDDAFGVSATSSFPSDETTWYPKDGIYRVDIDQHHSKCFITTATAGYGPTLTALREFREGVLRPTWFGRILIATYEYLSPPIAQTLANHPKSAITRTVSRLASCCADLARYRTVFDSGVSQAGLSVAIVFIYCIGLGVAVVGHIILVIYECLR